MISGHRGPDVNGIYLVSTSLLDCTGASVSDFSPKQRSLGGEKCGPGRHGASGGKQTSTRRTRRPLSSSSPAFSRVSVSLFLPPTLLSATPLSLFLALCLIRRGLSLRDSGPRLLLRSCSIARSNVSRTAPAFSGRKGSPPPHSLLFLAAMSSEVA